MKANELMIGDWVFMEEFHKHHKIVKSDFYGTSGSFNEFHPITITEEILKANGFVCTKYYLFSIPFGKYNFILEGSINNNETVFWMNIYSNRIQLKYVHELQHALRLCGLNEIADNFIITKND